MVVVITSGGYSTAMPPPIAFVGADFVVGKVPVYRLVWTLTPLVFVHYAPRVGLLRPLAVPLLLE